MNKLEEQILYLRKEILQLQKELTTDAPGGWNNTSLHVPYDSILCSQFVDCVYCPVAYETKKLDCLGTPFARVMKHTFITCDIVADQQKPMVEWLKELLQKLRTEQRPEGFMKATTTYRNGE